MGIKLRDKVTFIDIHIFMMTVLVVSLLLLVANSALSARIAGFHMAGGSQYLNTKLVLEELASRGHEVRFFARL